MSTYTRLTKVFRSSKEVFIDNSSKIILMSDVHRGNNSWSDKFARNTSIFVTALNHYFDSGFTYIEIGDGDELWENRSFFEIRHTYSHVFRLLQKFYNDNRLYMIYGNHDIVKSNRNFCKENLYKYYNYHKNKYEPLFGNIVCHEGLILKYENDKKIFVVHGHQGDFLNDKLWWFSRFLVRYIWRPLVFYIGFRDPTSPAMNNKRKKTIERRLIHWSEENKQMIITGHTHRPVFPTREDPLYFNTGCCVRPRKITGIEIENGKILLVQWSIKVDKNNALYIAREPISKELDLQYLLY